MTDKQILNAVRRAERHLHRATGYNPEGGHYKQVDAAHQEIEREMLRRLKPKPAVWAHVGPVQKGGRSLLDEALTHLTSGSTMKLWPAFDTAWGGGGGVPLIAPESCVVDTKDSSAAPGEAFYLTGTSTLRHWVAHLDRDWPLGHRFKKGDFIGKTLPIPGKSDHGHWAVNAEALLGKGKRLKYGSTGNGPDYSFGSPTIRKQLEALEL